MEVDQMQEGFICPICKEDYKGFETLLAHYKDKHSEDPMLLKTFKDIYGKAKKVLNKDQVGLTAGDSAMPDFYEKAKRKVLKSQAGGSADGSGSVRGTPGYQCSYASKTDVGCTRQHTSDFRLVRAMRLERYTRQTNNLLIRLGKLLENLPSDPLKRKVHEQQTVPWMDAKDVRLCPGCAKQFSILRRKHHCRLCGAVMCNDCSYQLPLETARRMVASVSVVTTTMDSPYRSDRSEAMKTVLRSPSSSSVQSVLSMDSSDTFFRLCEPCNSALEVHDRLYQARTHKPIMVQFYERLRAALNEVDPLLLTYAKIHSSLSCGETHHTLNDGHTVRVKILKLAETVDSVSKKIAVLGQNTETPPQGVELRLQKTIRMAATQFLQDHIITLPNLPTEEQLKIVQEQRRYEIARKIEEKKRFEAEAELEGQKPRPPSSYQRQAVVPGSRTNAKVNIEDGWTPEVGQSFAQSEDPVIDQLNNIREFIKQAKKAGRTDEVETLEKNLQELKEVFWQKLNTSTGEHVGGGADLEEQFARTQGGLLREAEN